MNNLTRSLVVVLLSGTALAAPANAAYTILFSTGTLPDGSPLRAGSAPAGPVTVLLMPNAASDGASETRISSSLIRISPLSGAKNSLGAIVLIAETSVSVDAVEARFLKALGAV